MPATLVVLGAVGLITLTWRAGGAPPTTPARAPVPSSEPLVTTIDIGHGGGIDVKVGEGGVWITTRDGLVELDPSTSRIRRDIAFEGAFDLAVADEAIWVTNAYRGVLARFDPISGTRTRTFRFRTGTPYGVAATQVSVWVTTSGSDGGTLLRLDPRTNRVVARIHIGPGSGAGGLGEVVADENAVWVLRGGRHDALLRVDSRTNQLTATVDVSNWDYWDDITLEGGALWVATGPHVRLNDGAGTSKVVVLRVDAHSNEVVDRVPIGHGMFGIGSGNGSVWTYDGFTDSLTQVDVTTGGIVRRIDIPDGGSSWGGDPGIDAAGSTVWMVGATSLIRVDLSPTESP
jgi:DNA-binding beta-propeller fold protein YncE